MVLVTHGAVRRAWATAATHVGRTTTSTIRAKGVIVASAARRRSAAAVAAVMGMCMGRGRVVLLWRSLLLCRHA